MTPRSLVLFSAFAALSTAMKCWNMTIPISISARNGVFDLKPPTAEFDLTALFLDISRPGNNATARYLKDYATVSGDYKLAATYCEAAARCSRDTLQILTHGVGFDRSYWDYPYHSWNYSYVREAVRDGYSTLSWDRLGVGESSHGDAVNEIQITLEIAALKAITDMARAGQLPHASRKFSKLIHVGHSFGSAMTYGLTAMYPSISDGIVLTGFSQVPEYMAYFVLGANFVPVNKIRSLANKYGAGYFAPQSKIGVHINFFGPDNFDPRLLDSAYKNGQAATVGELLTVGSGPSSSDFAGPVMIITGDRDIPFCGGNCMATTQKDASAPNLIEQSMDNFKKAKVFNATVVPDLGHALNYGYPAHRAFGIIGSFLNSNVEPPMKREAIRVRRSARRTSSRPRSG
ncbi:hypothetical protein E4U55_003203 [Claviceps digitariae]|nr:hypothetical protein E4U55_003203 [Claviceps digitariae]